MLRELLWVAAAGYIWGFASKLGWHGALYLRDHGHEVRLILPEHLRRYL